MMPADPTIAESAKQRSLRVPLDYLLRGDALARAKWLAVFVGGGIALAYVAWLMIGTRAGRVHASPGRVAAVHGAWNDDCSACHVSFRPLRSDAVDLVSLVRGADRVAERTLRDEACLKCHNVPVHQASERAGDVATCAACHREHGGAAFSIVRPHDSQCTSCHAEIEHHREGPSGLTPQTANVTGFGTPAIGGEAPHPAFRSLAGDPGNIKFNHWLHLQPGIAVADAKRKQRLDELPPERQAEYARFAQPDGLLQLDCAACHQPSERGDLMRPIAYEQHCRACHPLGVELADNKSGVTEVPHGLPAQRLGQVLDGMLVAAQERALPAAEPTTDESGESPLIPGKTLGRNLAQKLGQDVLVKRAKLEAAVVARCEQCHDWQEYLADDSAAGGLRDVRPANVPTRWLAHARFDHAGHRHVECRTCHAEAYAFEKRDQPRVLTLAELPPGFARARDNDEVMIAGMETCAACHAPRGGALGRARHDCAECHAYHGREHGSSAVVAGLRSTRGGASEELRPRADPGTQEGGRGYFLTALRASIAESKSPRLGAVGASSCAGAGCHGDVKREGPAWQSAFSTWLARDPHVQAHDVLWTVRGREMTRLLLSHSEAATEQEHRHVIEQRCVGCHATPVSDKTNEHSLGVECESCHGPAANWLHTHYRISFDRTAAQGFVDTKNLDARAAACLPCHVGPNDAAGERQVVDHELIAAGHPRLNFEFRSYLESLPAHWDRQQDQERQGPTFHYRTWLAGETKQAAALQALLEANERRPLDFALLDCAACHHALGTSDWRQRAEFTVLETRQPLPELIATNAAGRVAWARELLATGADASQKMSHDEAVRRYLAMRAVLADLEPTAAVSKALEELRHYLDTECYSPQRTQYTLPAAYGPQQLAERAGPLVAALTELEASLAEPRPAP